MNPIVSTTSMNVDKSSSVMETSTNQISLINPGTNVNNNTPLKRLNSTEANCGQLRPAELSRVNLSMLTSINNGQQNLQNLQKPAQMIQMSHFQGQQMSPNGNQVNLPNPNYARTSNIPNQNLGLNDFRTNPNTQNLGVFPLHQQRFPTTPPIIRLRTNNSQIRPPICDSPQLFDTSMRLSSNNDLSIKSLTSNPLNQISKGPQVFQRQLLNQMTHAPLSLIQSQTNQSENQILSDSSSIPNQVSCLDDTLAKGNDIRENQSQIRKPSCTEFNASSPFIPDKEVNEPNLEPRSSFFLRRESEKPLHKENELILNSKQDEPLSVDNKQQKLNTESTKLSNNGKNTAVKKKDLIDVETTSGLVLKNIKFFETQDTAKVPLIPVTLVSSNLKRNELLSSDINKTNSYNICTNNGVDESPMIHPNLRSIFQIPLKVAKIPLSNARNLKKGKRINKVNVKDKEKNRIFTNLTSKKSYNQLLNFSKKKPKSETFSPEEELLAFFHKSKSMVAKKWGKSSTLTTLYLMFIFFLRIWLHL